MSKLALIKEVVMSVLEDYKEHSAQELRDEIQKKGIVLSKESSAFRTAMYQLKNSGLRLESRERGVYCLVKEGANQKLDGFVVLKPIDRVSKCCVYVHDDGKIIMNGKLNSKMTSRKIEIRIADNGERIALIEEGKECHRFTKSGHTKNPEMIKLLGKKKISFPVCFEMQQYGNVWMGKLKRTRQETK